MSEFMKHNPNKQLVTPDSVSRLLENAQIVLPEDGVYNKLKSAEREGRQLRVKMGFDPTSPDLHLGHAVAMHQLRRLQDMGHLPVIIIGDFTGRIGDPSGRNKSRPLVSAEELTHNATTYINQLGKVLDTSRIEVHRNSEWLENMNLTDVIRMLAQGSLAQVISRDDFRNRLDAGSSIALHEIVYPFLQGTDSLAVNADIEVGGVDQLYAFQAGRLLQGNRGDDPQALIMMPLLRGLDGTKKMSKSLGNYIGLSDAPNDMFGKVMSIPDALIEEYLRLASTFDTTEIEAMLSYIAAGNNPMEVKLHLAHNIAQVYHGSDAAGQAREHFDRQFRVDRPEAREYSQVVVPEGTTSLIDILIISGIVDSRNKARRLIDGGGVSIDGKKANLEESENLTEVNGIRIKAGKRNFLQVQTQTVD